MLRSLFVLLAVLSSTVAYAQLTPEKALASMTAGDGLQVELFASEPMVINPTSLDIDHLGRVWVSEAVNYRRKNFGRPILRKEGDRIQVLIDEKGDGKATKAVTFYQGQELYGPLSVCVIPTNGGKSLRVLVAQSPDILEFTCKDSSNPVADGPPKKFLTGFGGFDHDHGVHGLHLGPDGKLYFTVGDSGVHGLQSSDGKGKKYQSNSTDCRAGTVWRCDLDGKNVELIAHNFRNNYEACVDSFGEIWLSDNDDDGNQQTRICFVMPGGNYGYNPRGAGQSHWHEEQPGIVHKALRTGFGSPTGIQFYEGSLLPKQYHNTLMHCDAGPREVRAFTRKPKGAGYELDKTLMLTSTDNWFRPSDVCTAPDGSVFVCDWYDPGVGGHGMGDWTRGRVYRLSPKGHKGYKVPEVKVDTKEGVLAALGNPCLSTRSLAMDVYASMKPDAAADAVYTTCLQKENPTLRLRAVRVLTAAALRADPAKSTEKFGDQSERVGESLGSDADDRIRAFSIAQIDELVERGRVPAELASQAYELYTKVAKPAALRVIILALRHLPAEKAAPVFYPLAQKYDGSDIFYRAALNIACGTDPVRRDAILADFDKHFPEWNDKVADLVWELRPKSMLPKMEKLLSDAKLTGVQKARIVDILAASEDAAAGKAMLSLLSSDASPEVKLRAVENLKLFLPTKWASLKKRDEIRAAISTQLKSKSPIFGLWLASAAPDCTQFEEVEEVVKNPSLHPEIRREAVITCGKIRNPKLTQFLQTLTADKDLGPVAVAAIGSHVAGPGNDAISKGALEALQSLVLNKDTTPTVKGSAVTALAGSRAGTQWLLAIKERGGFPETLVADAGRLLRNSPFQGERNKAMILFPAPGKLDPKKLPPITELVKRVGNPAKGKELMARSLTGESQCMKCHTVRGQGGSIGPDLSMIGKKASKENLYDSILTPSKAIADQYVSWKVDTDDGQSIVGLIVGETETTLTIRDANGRDYPFPVKGTERKKQLTSLMPDNLVATLTEDDLVDVVEYLMTLKTASLTPDTWHIAGPFAAEGDAALDKNHGPEKGVDLAAKYQDGDKAITWRSVRSTNTGYVDLAAFHGAAGVNSLSYMYRVVESPVDQDATILLGADDGCRVYVNGAKVFGHERHEAAAPERDVIPVKLKKGSNTILLKVNNGSNPHGFYFAITSNEELKLAK